MEQIFSSVASSGKIYVSADGLIFKTNVNIFEIDQDLWPTPHVTLIYGLDHLT